MLFTTPTQFAVLALLLLVGWLFGYASHSGGKRWRKAYDAEVAGRARDREELDGQRRQVDARIAELERDKAALATRNAELERELARGEPSSRGTPAGAASGVAAASAARPAFASETARSPAKRGWFDWSRGDDLTRLRGVDRELEARLKAERVERYRELAALSDQDELALERRLDLPAGYIQREQLREQARLLADGNAAEHAQRYG